ncbi:hypothetical protein HBDW_15460 [Herbaspirillum sp. DW155]|nr:hypothetical protein HBDW_15460 [Herbaspirillum sp. DW155]
MAYLAQQMKRLSWHLAARPEQAMRVKNLSELFFAARSRTGG